MSALPAIPCPLPADVAEPLARAADRLGRFGRQILWYQDVSSTNDIAASLAEGGACEGCVVAANAQSAGRGRQGRSWLSPGGAGLYVSAVLRPSADVVPLVTIAAGLAVSEGIEAATGLRPDLKWPNDIYIGGRKVAGVLAEANVGQYVVLGVGINVMPAAYPPEVAGRATSLEGELGRAIDRGVLLTECLSALTGRYTDLQERRVAAVIQAWRVRAAGMLRRRVQSHAAGRPIDGIAEGIDEDGALLVRTSAGIARITSGEVTWL